MTEPETKMPADLDEALLMLQSDPPELVKDKDGQAGNQKTKYADLNQVNEKVLTRLNDYGVIYKTKPMLNAEGKFVLRYVLKHLASGTFEDGDFPIPVSDNSQRIGSAISYARRYALLAITGVAPAEDDDGRSADGRGSAQRAQTRATGEQQREVAQRRPSGPSLPSEGKPISDPQFSKIQATFKDQGFTRSEDRHRFIVNVLAKTGVNREIKSTRDLTMAEAKAVIDALEAREQPPADGGDPA